MATGIRKLHSRGCADRKGGRCNCGAGYEASVFLPRENKKVRRTFKREAEARSWRADALSALGKGALRAPKPTTIGEAWEAWQEGAKAGTVRNRSGDRYKPSALRAYERAMRLRVLPALGSVRLTDLRRADLQEFADGLLAAGLNASTIQVTLLPLRAIYRRAIARSELAANPCTGLELPAVRGRRERFASPQEAAGLITALPIEDRALWATTMYGGLRRGELMALRDDDIDLAAGVIRVERGWDTVEGPIALKSGAGRRKVPIAGLLRDELVAHRMRSGRRGSDFTFGRMNTEPFQPESIQRRADAAWEGAGLPRITFHGCRHSFASLMIAAGVNAKALSTYMGHANISITLDRYGHLMPGNEDQAAGLLDAYLRAEREGDDDRARAAGEGLTGEPTGEQLASSADKPLVKAG